MKRHTLVLLLACFLLPSCRIHWNSDRHANHGDDLVLASRESEAGGKSSWKLYGDKRGAGARVDHTITSSTLTPRIGVSVGPVNRDRAQAVGVTPFEGVWLTKVAPNSAAAAVGLSMGDIVLAVDGVKMSSPEQFYDYMEQNAAVDEPLLFSIRVYRRQGEPIEPQNQANVEVRPIGVDVKETNTNSIPLESSTGVWSYTGLRAATLSAELCEQIYGESQSRIVVAGVRRGSPAYYAGLRVGDRVLSCDGAPIASLDDLRNAVALRIKLDELQVPLLDLPGHTEGEVSSDLNSEIVLDVEGPNGKHTAKFELIEDLDDESELYIPILYDHQFDIDSSEVSFLDFIFQFGFNYESRVRYSTTREPVETWELSILPLGMFEFEKGLNRSRTTLFWIIDFESN